MTGVIPEIAVLKEMTLSQKAALKWLINRGGDGVFSRNQVLIVRGQTAPIMRSTWTSLEKLKVVELYMNRRRLKVTDFGNKLDKLISVKESEASSRDSDDFDDFDNKFYFDE